MNFRIAFYVHHHGSGHYMRTVQVAQKLLKYKPILIGSNLSNKTKELDQNISILQLPMDIPTSVDIFYTEGTPVDGLHYAPLNIKGISDRNAIITDFFAKSGPLILVVDVSVEISLLARLCGIPTVVMRQHGTRTDLAHIMAYQCAEFLIAPYGKNLDLSKNDWIKEKTLFAGGFSRFGKFKNGNNSTLNHQIGIIIGKGGSSLNFQTILWIAAQCPSFTFHILGEFSDQKVKGSLNLIFHKYKENVQQIMETCALVIGNTGHNTVMEVATLNKCFIGIPEDRPFNEQLDKAKSIQHIDGYVTILPGEIMSTNWNVLINKTLQIIPDWADTIDKNAIDKIVNAIEDLGKKLYNH